MPVSSTRRKDSQEIAAAQPPKPVPLRTMPSFKLGIASEVVGAAMVGIGELMNNTQAVLTDPRNGTAMTISEPSPLAVPVMAIGAIFAAAGLIAVIGAYFSRKSASEETARR